MMMMMASKVDIYCLRLQWYDIIVGLEASGWLKEEDPRAYNPISSCR